MELIKRIKNFLIEKDYMDSDLSIGESDSLIESGILDSVATMSLLDFIEREFDIEVDYDDFTPENFDSFLSIKNYIESKL